MTQLNVIAPNKKHIEAKPGGIEVSAYFCILGQIKK